MVSRGQAGAEGWRWARTGWLVMRPTFSSMVAGPLAATARLWPMSDFVAASADIRGDYRYKLTRVWDAALSTLTFVLLNPSTADAVQVDPTLRRCMAFARREGYGGLDVVNLYAFRTKDPKVLMRRTLSGQTTTLSSLRSPEPSSRAGAPMRTLAASPKRCRYCHLFTP
jgi:hypothetical protein